MGWSGMRIGFGERWGARERRDFLVREMKPAPGSLARLADHSGLIAFSRVWGLHEIREDADSDVVAQRAIVLGQIKVYSGDIAWRFDDETVGPVHHDCPLRLLRAAMEFEPANDFARKWREEALAEHERNRSQQRIVRDLTRAFPHGDTRLVVGDRPGRFVLVQRFGGRTRRAYRPDGSHVLYGLSTSRINIEATEQLRATPAA